jgi:hypothetical protein
MFLHRSGGEMVKIDNSYHNSPMKCRIDILCQA